MINPPVAVSVRGLRRVRVWLWYNCDEEIVSSGEGDSCCLRV
jgi:hypothetical protein